MSRRAPSGVIDMLAEVPLFAGCNRRERGQIARLGTPVVVPAGTKLTVQGRSGSEFMLLLKGRARCLVDDVEVSVLGPGDFFGELALLEAGPRTATVIAESEVELLDLDQREFYGLIDTVPSISRKLLQVMAGYVRSAPPPNSLH
jgi:CRP/FNR family transcriptional regulator, cyclic AMP receptor protein